METVPPASLFKLFVQCRYACRWLAYVQEDNSISYNRVKRVGSTPLEGLESLDRSCPSTQVVLGLNPYSDGMYHAGTEAERWVLSAELEARGFNGSLWIISASLIELMSTFVKWWWLTPGWEFEGLQMHVWSSTQQFDPHNVSHIRVWLAYVTKKLAIKDTSRQIISH